MGSLYNSGFDGPGSALGTRWQRLESLLELCDRVRIDDPLTALKYAEESITLADKIGADEGRAASLRMRGLCRAEESPMDAIADLGQAAILYDGLGDVAKHAMTIVDLASAHVRAHAYNEAASRYYEAIDLASELEEMEITGAALRGLGSLYIDLGDFMAALKFYLRLLEIERERGNLDAIGSAFSQIAIVYGLLADYESALTYFTRALEQFRASKNRYLEVRALSNIADVHRSRGELQVALDYAMTSLTIYEMLDDQRSLAEALATVGNIHDQLGQHDVGLNYLLKALDAMEGSADESAQASVLLAVGKIYRRDRRYSDAVYILEQALLNVKEAKNRRLEFHVHEALADVFEQLGDPGRALQHFKLFARIKEEVQSQEKQRAIAEMQIRFDVERAEKEKEIYRLKAEQFESEVEHKKNELTAMALHLVQRNESLAALRAEVAEIVQAAEGEVRRKAKSLMQQIDTTRNSTEDWKTFEEQFQHVHQGFMSRLSQQYPLLTPTEVKICALTKISLSTKDIANILHTSARTVETHRYNIRKKLNLPTDSIFASVLAGI